MVNRLAIAKQFVQEQLQAREDIVGAMVLGSVARGDDNETSDIDLPIVVKGGGGGDNFDRSLSTWRNGVFLEAGLRPEEDFIDFTSVMGNPIAATHMNDALILYDPDGLLTELQGRVRAVYMEPRWIKLRLEPALARGRKGIAGLHGAVLSRARGQICGNMAELGYCFRSTPLLLRGITPSSGRPMSQMAEAFPDLWMRVAELEGSIDMRPEDVGALTGFFSRQCDLLDRIAWGGLVEYFEKKLPIMAKDGRHRDVIDLIWHVWQYVPKPEDAATKNDEEAMALAKDWLLAVGWDGEEVLKEKVKLAESILEEVEALAAALPPTKKVESS